MPGYRKILQDKYGRDNVHLRSHGILTRRPECPDFSQRGNPVHRILAFGKWGTYKRLELMIEAFSLVSKVLPNVNLVVGGGNHPQAAGYVESMKKEYVSNPAIEFTGYVPEDRLPELFQSSSVAVMPYSSSTGCSGVAHLACAYGVPIVCADLADFRQMASGEELAIEFYKPGSAEDLAECLIGFLTDPKKQQAMAAQNFAAALRMTMPTIMQKYLRHFELEQRAQALRYVRQFRRTPGWGASRSLLMRRMTRNSMGWVHRSAIARASASANGESSLVHDHVDARGRLAESGVRLTGDGVNRGKGRHSALSGFSSPISISSEDRDRSTSEEREEGKSSGS
jgi:hypothetical protein